jgi:hypothetical protein
MISHFDSARYESNKLLRSSISTGRSYLTNLLPLIKYILFLDLDRSFILGKSKAIQVILK